MVALTLVLFDLDDTLCDYSRARTGRLRGAFRMAFSANDECGVDLEAIVAESIAIHPHGSDHFPALLARHGVTDPELQRQARHWYHQNRFLGLKLIPGAREILDQIRAIPGVHSIGLITNGPKEIQRDKIELLGLRPHIDFAVISGEFGAEKPDPAIFHEALRLGDSRPGEAVYIGDSPDIDIQGARTAGIKPIWMNNTVKPWPEPTSPPITVSNLTEIPTIITCQTL